MHFILISFERNRDVIDTYIWLLLYLTRVSTIIRSILCIHYYSCCLLWFFCLQNRLIKSRLRFTILVIRHLSFSLDMLKVPNDWLNFIFYRLYFKIIFIYISDIWLGRRILNLVIHLWVVVEVIVLGETWRSVFNNMWILLLRVFLHCQ